MTEEFELEEPLEEITINLGDETGIREYYEEAFRCLQQIPCKSISKDWIKVIEPRKQTLHPYNGGEQAKRLSKDSDIDVGELCKPDWWPQDGCRHREPDHISRTGPSSPNRASCHPLTFSPERLTLLVHLLRNLWDPDAKSGYRTINVEKLAAATADTVAVWANQRMYRYHRTILEGIYNVRRAEERLRKGETGKRFHAGVRTEAH